MFAFYFADRRKGFQFLRSINGIAHQFTKKNFMIAVKKLFNNGKNIFRLNSVSVLFCIPLFLFSINVNNNICKSIVALPDNKCICGITNSIPEVAIADRMANKFTSHYTSKPPKMMICLYLYAAIKGETQYKDSICHSSTVLIYGNNIGG